MIVRVAQKWPFGCLILNLQLLFVRDGSYISTFHQSSLKIANTDTILLHLKY